MSTTSPRGNLVLLGFMGTGKTTLARTLQALYQVPWVDTDDLVLQATGRTPGDILRSEGEAAFRVYEREAVRRAAALDGTVVATGGGVPLDPENLEVLGERGVLVLLTVTPRTLARRMRLDPGDRPLLAERDLEGLEARMDSRREAYARVPRALATDGRDPESLARQLWMLWLQQR